MTSIARLQKLTPKAQEALEFARQEAHRLHYDSVSTEHILLGLLRVPAGGSATVLQKLGLNLDSARAEVEKYFGFGKVPNAPALPTLPVHTQLVLLAAEREAKKLNHAFIGTEHLLLGLLHQVQGPATYYPDSGIDDKNW